MYVIGLTGSIGSGKSTVSKEIRSRGICVLDADAISRELTSTASSIVSELVNTFGEGIIDSKGELNRRLLAKIAFSSDENKEKLSSLVTLKVKEIMDEEIKELERKGEGIVFLDVPLLFEYSMDESCDEVWSVVVDDDIRYERVRLRDGLSRHEFELRDKAQTSQEYKRTHSDVIIDNSGTRENLLNQIETELSKLNSRYGKETK